MTRRNSEVSLARRPHVGTLRTGRICDFATRKALISLRPFSFTPVAAMTTRASALRPSVMNRLKPLSSHLPAARSTAVVWTPPLSLPASGSVSAQAPIQSPLTSRGNTLRCWARVPCERMWPTASALCAAMSIASAPWCFAISRIASA